MLDRNFTDEDINALAEALHLRSVDHCRYQTDPDRHDPHHRFIQMMMDREKRREERIQKIQDYVAGSVLLSAFLAFVAFFGKLALEYIRTAK